LSTPALLSADNIFLLVQSAFKAICIRRNLTGERKEAFYRQAWEIVVGFGPVDATRAMLIGQGLMLNEMLADAASDAFEAVNEDMKRLARASYATVYRAFHQNQTALTRLQAKAEAAASAPTAAKPKAPKAEPASSLEPDTAAGHAVKGQTAAQAQPEKASPSAEPAFDGATGKAAAQQTATQVSATQPKQDAAAQINKDAPQAPHRDPPDLRTQNHGAKAPELAEA
jgi:hypothetical protein